MCMPKCAIIAVAFLVALCGCKTGELENRLDDMERQASGVETSFRAGNFAAADETFSKLASEQTVSSPLYRLDRIPCLILSGRKNEAYKAMRELRVELEELYDPESERKALSKWHGEVNKVFKGSPYEMATFYALMSLACAERGDYEDAWRCVQNGLLHDSDVAEEKYRSDDALLLYLGSVFADKIGEVDSAEQCRKRLKDALAARNIAVADIAKYGNSAYGALLGESASKPNVFVVFWTGTPPQYGRAGEYGEKRTILSGLESAADFMTVSVDGNAEMPVPRKIGDINFQATTRGGRVMDNILADKAEFKQDMKNFKEVSVGISGVFFAASTATFNSSKEMLIISGGLAAAGVAFLVVDGVCYVFYDTTDPRADIRTWKTLPGQLDVIPLCLAPGKHEIVARAYIGGDALARASFSVDVPNDGRMAVAHFFGMNDAVLSEAEHLSNQTCGMCNSNAPREPVLQYPDVGGGWDTSAWYAISGSETSGSRFKLKYQEMPFRLLEAMRRNAYLRHWSADGVMSGTCPIRPSKVLYFTGSHWFLNKSADGLPVLDVRVSLAVRGAGDKAQSGEFKSDPVRHFYAWSRQATDKTAVSALTTGEINAGVDAALDNLFKIREFREAMQR